MAMLPTSKRSYAGYHMDISLDSYSSLFMNGLLCFPLHVIPFTVCFGVNKPQETTLSLLWLKRMQSYLHIDILRFPNFGSSINLNELKEK